MSSSLTPVGHLTRNRDSDMQVRPYTDQRLRTCPYHAHGLHGRILHEMFVLPSFSLAPAWSTYHLLEYSTIHIQLYLVINVKYENCASLIMLHTVSFTYLILPEDEFQPRKFQQCQPQPGSVSPRSPHLMVWPNWFVCFWSVIGKNMGISLLCLWLLS